MRRTQKYSKAIELLTFPHNTQEELYLELNRLDFYWNSKTQQWVRDDRLAEPPMLGVKIRIWASEEDIEYHSDLIIQILAENGYILVDKSKPYPCRPPKQNESRIYLHLHKNS
jgi:hypothetical protein